MSYLLTLPWSPSINSYYGITCNGRIPHKFIKEKGKEYRETVKNYIKDNNLELRANINLKVTIQLTPPDHRTHDIDNNLKSLFDSLTHAKFWQDDSYVKELHISYNPPQKPGSILMHVTPLDF